LESYTDESNQIKYTFSTKHSTWIPDQSTYSANDPEGTAQTYVWLKDQLQWALLSSVDTYTDHVTGTKYQWNSETNSWDNQGVEPIDDDQQQQRPATIPKETQPVKKKPDEGSFVLTLTRRQTCAWL
uniref:hypothetical protein n=1 Tax=Sphingomonas sp. TaxID=28214 RepID=UPI0025D4CD98